MLDWMLEMQCLHKDNYMYIAVSQVTSVHKIKAIWDSNVDRCVTKNIVYPEVIID